MPSSYPCERKFWWTGPDSEQEYWIFGPNTRNEGGDFYRHGVYKEPSRFTIERLLQRVMVKEELDPDLQMDVGL